MIKLFEQFNEYNQIKEWLYNMRITGFKINDDLTVDVNGGVYIVNRKLTHLPVIFNKVNGSFDCSYNKLTTLVGSPKYLGGNFNCQDNKLTSLDGLELVECKIFNCGHNEITSLKGSPKTIYGNFSCYDNKLTSLEYCPEYINGMFHCGGNLITTLKYFPNDIQDGMIIIAHNPLPTEILEFNTRVLMNNQEDYGIWNSDGSFNKARFDLFEKDYEAGKIK